MNGAEAWLFSAHTHTHAHTPWDSFGELFMVRAWADALDVYLLLGNNETKTGQLPQRQHKKKNNVTAATDREHITWYAPVASQLEVYARCELWSTKCHYECVCFVLRFFLFQLLYILPQQLLLLLLLSLVLPVMIVFSSHSSLDIASFPKSFVTSRKFRHEQKK